MTREFNVVIERDEDGLYVASVPALPGCHTQANSLEELDERIAEAIELWLEVAANEPANLDFVEVRKVVITKRGKPAARVLPCPQTPERMIGALRRKISVRGDIVSTGAAWDVDAQS